jgi:hypothetical protein
MVTIVVVVVDHQMVVMIVHVRKNMVDNVLLDGGLGVNVITYGLR